MVTMDDFRQALDSIFARAMAAGRSSVEVVSSDLHDSVVGVSGLQRMPMACNAMHAAMRSSDQVLETSPSGQTSRLRIRYQLPR